MLQEKNLFLIRNAVAVAILFFTICLQGSSQGVKRWYFGQFSGINFTTSPPSFLSNSAMNAGEGCATLTDAAGNLMLYTDGITVYNRNHAPMPNGMDLAAHFSSSQAALVVPLPGSSNKYYIFTTGEHPEGRFHYSVVDMSLNSGLGDVITKNVFIDSLVSEQLSAVRHSNGTDFWITVHRFDNSNVFSSYLLTSAGFTVTPVNSAVGPVVTGINTGQMKFSPSGTKIAFPFMAENTVSEPKQIVLCDFDATTGQISNPLSLPLQDFPGEFENPYGVEFSASGRFLYATDFFGKLYQWNLTASSAMAVTASRQKVGDLTGMDRFGGLQLAPDGKIYAAVVFSEWLAAIEHPEVQGSLCGFTRQAVHLAPGLSVHGLPGLVQSAVHIPFYIQATGFCSGSPVQFSATTTATLTNYQWNFGDPASGSLNTSTSASPAHIFAAPGTYTVSLTATSGSVSQTQTYIIEIQASPAVTISPNGPIQICPGESVTLQTPFVGGAQYQWMRDNLPLPVDTLNTLTVTAPGNYNVIYQDAGICPAPSAFVQVTLKPAANALISPNGQVSICPGTSTVLNAQQSTGSVFAWLRNGQPVLGANSPEIVASSTGNYQVIVSGAGLCADTSDVVTVNWLLTPSAAAFPLTPTSVCAGEMVTLTVASVTGSVYQWIKNGSALAGATTTSISTLESGSFQVIVTAGNSCSDTSEAVQVNVYSYPETELLASETDFCEGESVALSAPGNTGYSYTWFRDDQQISGASSNEFTVSGSGNYKVRVVNAGLCADTSDAITITQIPLPEVKIEVIPGLDCGEAVTLRASGADTYSWSTGQTGSEIRVLPVRPENYAVTGQSPEGCATTANVDVESDCPTIAPNIITPNGDGVNDVFVLKYPIQDYDLQVCNRWGKPVFERKNYGKNPDWKGEGLPDGVYFYSISTFKGEQLKGWVEIAR